MGRKMIRDGGLIAIFLLAAITLLPSACGIQISVSSDAGGLTEQIKAADDQAVNGRTVIAADGLSHSIEGSGSLRDSHWVSNMAWAVAGVGVDVRNADSYSYGYSLTPGKGFLWPASKYPWVEASETLDVLNAQYIRAYATAHNARGYAATVSTEILDPEKKASLRGYANSASASANEVSASQTAKSASAPNGYIKTKAESESIQLRWLARGRKSETITESLYIEKGSISGYSEQTRASAAELKASQHLDSAQGSQIQAKSASTSWIESFFKGAKKTTDAEVSTTVFGKLDGYDASIEKSSKLAQATLTGHASGTFASTAEANKATKTRTSNYGTDYDLKMLAGKDSSGSYASGILGYYVDDDNPAANRIQGAVDASQSGDSINVAAGTYRENPDIQKSLRVLGAGAGETVVDGSQAGSVFTIGSLSNGELDVALSGMTITNGTGTSIAVIPSIPDLKPKLGGGILNYATLRVDESRIAGNRASVGAGIFNYLGAVDMDAVSIDHNNAIAGGGIASYYGEINLYSGSIENNNAAVGGGVAAYESELGMDGGSIDNNNAAVGGGIAAYESELEIDGGSINRNKAIVGGGIASYQGSLNLNGGSIDHNLATAEKSIYEYLDQLGLNDGSLDPKTAAAVEELTGYNLDELKFKGAIVAGEISAFLDELDKNGVSIDREKLTAGGGIASFKTDLNLNGGSIDHNIATMGGGIASYGGAMNMSGVSIERNSATVGGGLATIYSQMNLDGGSISNNSAAIGGGMASYGGIADLNGGFVSDNMAAAGGGVANYQGLAILNGSSVSGNMATRVGGGILNYKGTMNLMSGSVDHNSATMGGGIYNTGMVIGDAGLVHDNSPNQVFP